jgi:hypothetical protein
MVCGYSFFEVAHQGAGGRHARDEFQQQILNRFGLDGTQRRHHH